MSSTHPVLAEHERRAAQLLPASACDYYATGSGAELSLAEAAAAWDALRFRPHGLRDVRVVDTSLELFGRRLATPVLVAPTASHRLAHPEAEVATARGARSAGSLLALSTRANARYEDVAAELPDGWWFQVYLTRAREVSTAAFARVVAAGATALVLTADTPYVATKARPITIDLGAGNLHVPDGMQADIALDQDPGATEADIAALAATGLPVLVKGVLRADDAQRFVAAGASGLIVSNHGGRQLDQAIPSARALPEVVGAVDVPVLVDGGIRNGRHVLAALALGARAVMVGRPVLWALAAGGADGVAAALTALTDDLAQSMALAGVRHLAEIDRSLVG